MTVTYLIYILLISAALSVVERRWRVPYLQGIGRLLAGLSLVQFSFYFVTPKNLLFAVLGLGWLALGARDIQQQRRARQN